jgi:hypothetical protein
MTAEDEPKGIAYALGGHGPPLQKNLEHFKI